ncbi:hypothetical protein AB0L57_09450 [Nocardia sp. NPDC052254]|uniref:hypothetical protein n=1 Tax=Nocardia sp. NPDC052254 TaxID=3155681 RepID=UPI0034122A1D
MHETTTIATARRGVGARVGTAVAGAALGAAAVIALATPQIAAAATTQVGAMPDLSFGVGTNYGDTCHYTLQANVTDPSAPVSFYDNGAPVGVARPGGAYALIGWVPAYAGHHTLTAIQAGQPAEMPVASLDLPVGTGVPIGFGCVVVGG